MINNIPFEYRNSSGIYIIRNLIDKRIYIGSAIHFTRRLRVHRHHLVKGSHHSKPLQHFVNKYGIDTLSFNLMELVDTDNLIEREQFYLDTMTPFVNRNGFNIYQNAQSMKGLKHRPESIKKMVDARRANGSYNKGRITVSMETKLKLSKALTGRVSGFKGKIWIEESKDKLRRNRQGKNYPKLFGRSHSEGTKKKLSILMMGNKHGLGKKASDQKKVILSLKRIKPQLIIQKNLNNEIVNSFNSLHEASKQTGYDKRNIQAICAGRGKSYKGYKWEYGNKRTHP